MTRPSRLLPFDRSHPLLVAVRTQSPTEEAARLLRDIERDTGMTLAPFDLGREVESFADIDERSARAFLKATQFAISGGDLQTHFDIFDGGHLREGFSWREWGALVAEWANATWPTGVVGPRAWDPVDFYSSAEAANSVTDYEGWLEGWKRLVALKCQLFGMPGQ